MPNRETHLGIGLAILIAYYFVLNYFSATQYLVYGVAVFIGAIFPDIIEPWRKENRYTHRGFWHSKRVLKKLWIIAGVSLLLSFIFPGILILLLFTLGYISHLVADSRFVGHYINGKDWSRGLPD